MFTVPAYFLEKEIPSACTIFVAAIYYSSGNANVIAQYQANKKVSNARMMPLLFH
jgi:hypothetical protein